MRVRRIGLAVSMVSLPAALAAQTQPPTASAPPTAGPAPARAPAQRPAQRTRPAAHTAQPPAADEAGEETPDIVVNGRRTQPGAVIGDIPPEQQLSPADIRSYGVSTVADLLSELAPQTGSVRGGGGPPVVLLDGRRIGGFQEIRDIPTEAIQRVDILPEEVALKYGYRADQRVVNIVLRRRFRAITTELAGGAPTEGGRFSVQPTADILTINNGRRLNLHVDYQSSTQLLESARDIASTPNLFSVPGNVLTAGGAIYGVPAAAASGPASLAQFTATGQTATNPSPYRTLLPDTDELQINTVYATNVFGKVSATFNGRVDVTDSRSFQGLQSVALALPAANPFNPFGAPITVDRALNQFLPLAQDTQAVTSHLGATFNGDKGKWRYTLAAVYDRVESRTITELGADASALQAALTANTAGVNPFAPLAPGGLIGPAPAGIARSLSNTEGVDALVSGPIVELPAGPLSTSIHVAGNFADFSSSSTRFGIVSAGQVTRNSANGQANIDIPLTSRRKAFLSAIGDLSANVNVAVDHLSDFGTLTTIGYGANWSPIAPVRLLFSHTTQDDAPTANQLADPTISTPNVRTFDYVTGQSVNVTRIGGGNPFLIADNKRVTKFGLTVKPSTKLDLTITADYVETHTRNPIGSLSIASAALEAAFPARFTRVGGALTSIDQRPVNFAESESHVLRHGFNLSIPLKSKLQKQFEAFRAGKGPNPFQGLFPNGQRPTPPQSVFGGSVFGGGGQRGQRDGQAGPPPGGAPPGGGEGGAAGANSGSGAGATTGAQGAPGVAPTGGPPGGFGGGPGGGGFGGRGGGGRGGFGGGQAGGRLQFALFHTWYFEDRLRLTPAAPLLDALNGDTIGSSAGGQARHLLEGQAGYSNNGFGVRMSANYQSGTSVRTGPLGSSNMLNFGSLATLDLRLFEDLTQKLRYIIKHPWARGVRFSLSITNLFDTRQRVTDQTGATPINYQPDYLNPLGRSVRLSVRKLIF